MQVTTLWRYPVKSMLGERRPHLDLDSRGVEGDRLYTICDTEGKFGSGKNTRRFRKIDGLFGFAARYDDDVPVLRFPDGTSLRGDDRKMDTALSRALGLTVTLAREAAVSHFDAGPVHIITTSALAWLKRLLPDSAIDERRFRPNLVIDTPGDGFPEREWSGRTVIIGDATLKIQEPTERCGMVTFRQSELDFEPGILRTIAREADLNFGVYADVVVPGRINQGDDFLLSNDWRTFSDLL